MRCWSGFAHFSGDSCHSVRSVLRCWQQCVESEQHVLVPAAVMPRDRKPSKVDMLKAETEYIRLLSAVLKHSSAASNGDANVLLEAGINCSSLETGCSDLWSMEDVLESTSSPFLSESVTTEADDDLDLNNMMVQCVVPMYIAQVGSEQTVLTSALSS